jgi:hypothetical protein
MKEIETKQITQKELLWLVANRFQGKIPAETPAKPTKHRFKQVKQPSHIPKHPKRR